MKCEECKSCYWYYDGYGAGPSCHANGYGRKIYGDICVIYKPIEQKKKKTILDEYEEWIAEWN